MSVIRVKKLIKVYGKDDVVEQALNGVDLTIEKGEFSAIVGPSGSGKTTLLNIIGGLDKADSGSVRVDNVDIGRMSGGERTQFRLHKIGFIFQAYNLLPVLTARENTGFIMQLQGVDAEQRRKRVDKLLHSVGLGDKMDSPPGKMSGGQQQRVAVARALAAKPALVLADEPTANLDSGSSENLLMIMSRLNEEEGTTFVFSTHDMRVIRKARRVVTLEDGKVIKDES
ncbi:MAG: ATP-binding cassette domain-containing protein [Chitinivibrionales bacterium]|nr:ATP-binding cassette domain-containing protein [Chitinivibrionales bacterium]